jgi:hypothetical protein
MEGADALHRSPPPPDRAVSVEYGKAVSFDFPARVFPVGARQRLRAVVIVAPDPSGIAPCVMPSVEVLNNETGKTVMLYPGSLIGW